ncbi:hypothetical protein C7U62_03530 [Mesorhizobium loti]|nr:hypothetical protein SMRU11_21675 [Sinorhizobium meliloti RU11/001]PST28768.1 hypothetical protein C7U62_03530 [Mesorhizobium loti]
MCFPKGKPFRAKPPRTESGQRGRAKARPTAAGGTVKWRADRLTAVDFGDGCALPNVLFDVEGARPIPTFVLDALRAFRHDDPGLRMFAEYNPQDMVFWL